MRCMYGFYKSGSRTKAYREHKLFYFIRFPRPCLQYNLIRAVFFQNLNVYLRKT